MNDPARTRCRAIRCLPGEIAPYVLLPGDPARAERISREHLDDARLVMTNRELLVSLFNFGFGLIDLYQALASVVGLTPIEYFHWTFVDDVLHVLIGFALVLIGAYGLRRKPAAD